MTRRSLGQAGVPRHRRQRSRGRRLLPWLTLQPTDTEHHAAVVAKLERLRGHKLTYVDASSLVLLRRLRIRTVWGTDRDLSIEGARVIPSGA